ncbi:hypothetical protein B0J14DRAFT_583270 [Halenospora varia]|nr:hypothetical protein B0J14DRAFT_583270 [Halenospora varia]
MQLRQSIQSSQLTYLVISLLICIPQGHGGPDLESFLPSSIPMARRRNDDGSLCCNVSEVHRIRSLNHNFGALDDLILGIRIGAGKMPSRSLDLIQLTVGNGWPRHDGCFPDKARRYMSSL